MGIAGSRCTQPLHHHTSCAFCAWLQVLSQLNTEVEALLVQAKPFMPKSNENKIVHKTGE
jgi:hypothetical protein